MNITAKALENMYEGFFREDDLSRNFHYINSLPKEMVKCKLKFKDDMIISGLPFFVEAFNYLEPGIFKIENEKEFEGRKVAKADKVEVEFELPFNVVLTGERIALNLLQKSSSITSFTNKFVEKASLKNIEILDTRKTTPGHRVIEKYAVQAGGGKNHRFGQADCWMIKDNHKSFFGGLEQALDFFKGINSFYTPVVVEIHNLDELKEGLELNIKHFMLDNFSPEKIAEAVKLKKEGVTFEVSGGITLENLEGYLVDGVDAISSGSLTYNAPHMDISLKYERK